MLVSACGPDPQLYPVCLAHEGDRACDLLPEIPGIPVIECIGGRWLPVQDCAERCWDDLRGHAYCDDAAQIAIDHLG